MEINETAHYHLSFYVPESHLEAVKTALFAAGAGRDGNYEACCWQVLGEGQFRPTADAQPFIGALETLNKVPEYKVEMVVTRNVLTDVIAALKQHHPYEAPAYHVLPLWQV